MKVCILGLGEVGLPTAVHIAQKGHKVYGFDISRTAIQRAQEENIKATNKWNTIEGNLDGYVICVPTGIDADLRPDMSAVFDASRRIASNMSNNPLVSVESTVSPGTCRALYNYVFKESVAIVHVPHRFWKEDPIRHGVRQKRVIGAINSASLEKGLDFYRQLDVPLHTVSSIETAEMSKIVENSHRFLQIAFAEELKMICDELGIDTIELRAACNTKWNTDILEARDGILGHCLPKDIRYLISLSPNSKLLRSAVSVDKKYFKYIRGKNRFKSI